MGQRPKSPGSKHNMPSGHSTLASAAAFYTVRQYTGWLGFVVRPVLILTMYARYMLDALTISATIAEAMTGILVAAVFTRPGFRVRCILAAVSQVTRQTDAL